MRWALLLLLVAVLAVLGLWAVVRTGEGPLEGLRIGGEPVDSGQPLAAQLAVRAQVYADELVTIRSGPSQSQRMRRALGASLEVATVLGRAERLGRGGNPIAGLRKWWAARQGRLDLAWPVSVDSKRLGAFVQLERERVELPPKVGVSDGEGWSLPGEEGVTLDYHRAIAVLKRALSAGESEVELPLRKVPAPPPIVIGSPDGELFDADEAHAPEAARLLGATADAVPPAAYAGLQWQVGRGKECYEKPPLRAFCDGPRMVPVPTGQGAAVANQLGLGRVSAVRKVLGRAPPPGWVAAAGGPEAPQALRWPVPAGHFGRGFGYVRKRAAVKDRLHKGIDIPARSGSPIVAVSDGVVAYSDNGIRGYGNLLIIVHGDGAVTLSAHCRRIFVFGGQRVRAGQVVAEVGATGMAMGPHLHFEYHLAGRPTDPKPLFGQIPRRK